MQIDALTKVMLAVIALFLGVLIVRPVLEPAPGYAAKTMIQYKVVSDSFQTFADLEAALNVLGSAGWEVVAPAGGALVLRRSSER